MPIGAIPLYCALLLQSPPQQQEVVIHTHPYIPPPPSTLTVETNLVESILVIRDNRGKPIGGFHATDFHVFDNSKPEQILSFTQSGVPEPESSSPKTTSSPTTPKSPAPAGPSKLVTLFFDDLHTETPDLMPAVGAARKFITTALQPTDRISIATSSNTADLDFTSDAAAIQATLDQVRTHSRPQTMGCPALKPVDAYLFLRNIDSEVRTQAIEDAKICLCAPDLEPACVNSTATRLSAPGLASSAAETVWGQTETQSNNALSALGDSARRLAASSGQRILVLISSGFLPPMQRQMETIINAALRWNITIHSLDAKGLDATREGFTNGGYNNTRADRTQLTRQTAFWEPLEKMSSGTGGHFFHNTNDLAAAIEMATTPAVSYVLSFNPGERDGQFHTLKIAFKNRSSYSLQFRPGYFSPANTNNDSKKDPGNRASLDAAVFSKQNLNDLRADITCSPGEAAISVAVNLDLKHVEFKTDNGRHIQQIVFLMTLLDSSGSFITGKEAIMDLALTDEKLASLQQTGLKAVATLNAPPGTYQVRTIVRESMKGSLAATTTPVDLR